MRSLHLGHMPCLVTSVEVLGFFGLTTIEVLTVWAGTLDYSRR